MDEQEYIAKRFPSIKPRDQYTAAVVLYTANNTFVRLEEAEEAKLFLEREMNALEPDYHYLINLEEIQLPTTYEELFRHDPMRLKFSGATRVILTAEGQPADNDEGPILCGFYFKPEHQVGAAE